MIYQDAQQSVDDYLNTVEREITIISDHTACISGLHLWVFFKGFLTFRFLQTNMFQESAWPSVYVQIAETHLLSKKREELDIDNVFSKIDKEMETTGLPM